MSKRTVQRYLTIFDLLTRYPAGLTREQLRFAVPEYRQMPLEASFTRKFERDKAALRMMGLMDERTVGSGVEFRYRVPRAEQNGVRPVKFGGAGAATLAWCAGSWVPGQIAESLSKAMVRVGWLESQSQPQLLEVRHRLLEAEGLYVAVVCLAEGRVMDFAYEDLASGTFSQRSLRLCALGQRFGRWYVFGWEGSIGAGAAKSFRLDRMQNLSAGEKVEQKIPVIDLEQELNDLSRASVQRVSVVVPGESGARSEPSYSAGETVATALKNGWVVASGSRSNSAESYQQRVRLLYLSSLNLLAEIHGGKVGNLGHLVWKDMGGLREKASSESSTLHLLALARFAEANPGMKSKEVAAHFGLGPTALRRQLDLLYTSLGEDNFDYDEDEGRLYVRTGSHLQQAAHFTALEVGLLFLTIALMRASGMHHSLLDEAETLLSLFSAEGRELSARIAVFDDSADTSLIREAAEHGELLRVRYSSAHSQGQRTIAPLELFVDLEHRYLKAWCFLRQSVRIFRLDRLQVLEVVEQDDVAQAHLPSRASSASGLKVEAEQTAVIRLISQPKPPLAHTVLESLGQHSADEGGHRYLKLPLAHSSWLEDFVISCAGSVEVLEPQKLRERILLRAQKLQSVAFPHTLS